MTSRKVLAVPSVLVRVSSMRSTSSATCAQRLSRSMVSSSARAPVRPSLAVCTVCPSERIPSRSMRPSTGVNADRETSVAGVTTSVASRSLVAASTRAAWRFGPTKGIHS